MNDLFHCPPNVPHYAKNKAVGTMKPGMVSPPHPMSFIIPHHIMLHLSQVFTIEPVRSIQTSSHKPTFDLVVLDRCSIWGNGGKKSIGQIIGRRPQPTACAAPNSKRLYCQSSSPRPPCNFTLTLTTALPKPESRFSPQENLDKICNDGD